VTATRPGNHRGRAWLVHRPSAAAALFAGLLAVLAGVGGVAVASRSGHPGLMAEPVAPGPVPHGVPAARPRPGRQARVPPPVRLIIPAIRVRTRLVRLGLTSGGNLQVPASPAVAGWYDKGPRPGAVGPAVIAGHIDSRAGPGVFFRLRLLRPRDRVYVRRRGGSLAAFSVTAVRRYAKTRFPDAAVYGPVPEPELRLITCGGTFDWATGHYLADIVVFATMIR
jgi:hypothetical protein